MNTIKNTIKSVDCHCGLKAELVGGQEIYPHRKDLYSLIFYKCSCGSYVGCHKGTTRPLGTPASYEVRKARSAAHRAFDPLWRNAYNSKMERARCYKMLAAYMDIASNDCHIGSFDVAQCDIVLDFVTDFKTGSI